MQLVPLLVHRDHPHSLHPRYNRITAALELRTYYLDPSRNCGVATNPSLANSPAQNFPQAAAAIIAALSVDIAIVGNATRSPRRAASSANRRLSSLFADTPPDTTIPRAPNDSAAANV